MATLGIALVAVTVGVRLVSGGMAFEAALTVLVLSPELYLPLRNGAQANVLILTDPDAWLLNPLGRLWLRVISWLRYIY